MSSIFDALPGQETPVGAISKSLARMWATDERATASAKPGEDSKATQVNFVLHLGLHTTPPDAIAQFQTAVRFSRRYPCRVVVLCPTREEDVKECSQERDDGYRDCCDWWPCSWACDSWTWVSHIVCIAWSWVKHTFCVVWSYVKEKVCLAFAWVVDKATCWSK